MQHGRNRHERHKEDFTCRLKRLRTRQRRQRLQMLKAIGCCSECQVRQIHFVFQPCLIKLFTLSVCFDALKDLSQTTFPLKGVFVVNGIQFCSMPGFFEEAPVLAPDEAQRAIDLKEYAKIQYNDI